MRAQWDATRAAQLVEAFDASGVHRMASPGDLASGAWFEQQTQECGVAVQRMPVFTTRTVVEAAHIECAGTRIDGLPMFDSPSCAELSGALAPCGDKGEIGYAEFPPNAASIKGQPLEKLRRATSHRAMVVATRVSGDSLAPINAQFYDAPFGPPLLLVAGMQHAWLAQHAAQRARATLVSCYRREAVQSFNIEAHAASGACAAPIAVVTPRTGWWESTAERAGGMVAWLAALHAAGTLKQDSRLKRDVFGWATCGHELGHIGLNELTRRHTPLITRAHYWLHLGANLGGALNLALMVRAADTADAQRMRDLLVEEGYPAPHIKVEPADKFSGEGHDLAHMGAKVLSLAGSNLHFHAASDRWPGNVNAAGIAAISRAVARWVALQTG